MEVLKLIKPKISNNRSPKGKTQGNFKRSPLPQHPRASLGPGSMVGNWAKEGNGKRKKDSVSLERAACFFLTISPPRSLVRPGPRQGPRLPDTQIPKEYSRDLRVSLLAGQWTTSQLHRPESITVSHYKKNGGNIVTLYVRLILTRFQQIQNM